MAANLLFLIDHPPRRHDLVREEVDLVLAALALEQTVTVAFVADGVYHCLAPRSSPGRDPSAAFGSLSLYDVNRMVVESESLTERGLRDASLRFEVEPIARQALRQLLRAQDLVL